MNDRDRVFVAGHTGLVGSAICRRLEVEDCTLLLRTSKELDLRRQADVDRFFVDERPSVVILAAAKVGGIAANDSRPADFIADNLQIQTNVIVAAHKYGVRKFVFLGSSCIYPRDAMQPMREDCLLSGPLEPTNQWYAVAKIAGIKLCQAYRLQHGFDAISLMPTNLYGPNDNFDLETSHVLPALIRKFVEAKAQGHSEVSLWGSGTVRREFLYVDDLADAVAYLTRHYSQPEIVNIGFGRDITILELAQLVGELAGYKGTIGFDASRPDGAPRKLLDISRLQSLGWQASISLRDGISQTIQWYLQHASGHDASP